MSLNAAQLKDLRLLFPEKKQLSKSPSDGSVSTRAPTRVGSNGSLFDQPPRATEALPQPEDTTAVTSVTKPRPFPTCKVLCAIAVFVLYRMWSKYVRRLVKSPNKWGYGSISLLCGALISKGAAALGVTGWSQPKHEPACVPQKQYLACLHPHGCFGIGCISNLATEPRNKYSPLRGVFIGVADVLFKIPLVREFLLVLNARPASATMLEALLANGKSVALYPGGIHEQMATDSTCERLYFPPNLGFVRQAMKHGVPLVPVYNFGENQVVGVPDWSREISESIRKYTGAGVPVPIGRWGLPGVPNKTHVKTYMGREVDVGGVNPDPTDTQVREVFLRYCAELHRLFNEHSESSLPAKVVAKGLTIIWRGHESEDFSERSVQLALGESRQSRSRL